MKIDPRILLCPDRRLHGCYEPASVGGLTARAATVLEMDATELWHMLIPLQVVGLVMNIALAVVLA